MPAGDDRFITKILKNGDILAAVGVVAVLVMIIVPIWTWLLNLGIALNITLSIIILLTVMYAAKPIDFSIFPSLLLVTTVFRLALNVSSTRKILIQGKNGVTGIITAFGDFVVGGNYVVGFVIFAILLIIQIMVIVKGATRISEVAARFTLDALPGKQMAIDAEMQSGLITQIEATQRRDEIRREADFYGAMDGASKFVQGDVWAGLIITGINLLGGIVIGMWLRGEGFQEALTTYALLMIGDGLVAQIPSLMIAASTGLIVTRAATQSNVGTAVVQQITQQPRALMLAGGFLMFLGVVPGVPLLLLWPLGGGLIWLGRIIKDITFAEAEAEQAPEEDQAPRQPENVVSLLQVDPMELEVGYGLIPLVDPEQGGDLLDRVTLIRKQCALDYGIIVPPIRIRDNMQLRPNAYIIKIKGVEISGSDIRADGFLAMDSGNVREPIAGEETREPAFNLKALWITGDQRERAEMAGYTVVDPPSIIATHLTEIIKRHAHDLLTLQDVSKLRDNVKETYPALVDVLNEQKVGLGEIQKVLQRLLQESVSIRNLVTILETIAEAKSRGYGDPAIVTEFVRMALARQICAQHVSGEGTLRVMTLSPQIEEAMVRSLQQTPDGEEMSLDPRLLHRITENLNGMIEDIMNQGWQPILVVQPRLRPHVKRITERTSSGLTVLSYSEIVNTVRVESLGMINAEVA